MAAPTQLIAQTTPQTVARRERSLQMALAAARAMEDNRGTDIVILDLQEQTPIFDYFVIATGTSQRQLRAMADGVEETLLKEMDKARLSQQGYDSSNWVLVDFGPVVVHLFDAAGRDYYRLEDLWATAGRVDRGPSLRAAPAAE